MIIKKSHLPGVKTVRSLKEALQHISGEVEKFHFAALAAQKAAKVGHNVALRR